MFTRMINESLTLPENTKRTTVGRSLQKREIHLYRFGAGTLKVYLMGGVHGNETEGFMFLDRFIKEIRESRIKLHPSLSLFITDRTNPDGCACLRRTNHRNVDLNRNFPAKNWTENFTDLRYFPGASPASEEETKITLNIIQHIEPKLIISLHSYHLPMNNYNGPAKDIADAMSKKNGLESKADIGYPTPGSLGTWAGEERGIPVITLEILRGESQEDVYRKHLEAVLSGIHFYIDHPVKN